MTIDQAGLPAGVANQARTDGLATGALVTLTSVGGGATSRFALLWVPPADTTAVASLVESSPGVWTFSPTVGARGSYRIELIVDEGLPTESRQVRIFGIRTASAGLLIPAANERADATTTLPNFGSGAIQRSENNEPFSPFATGSAWGWWKALSDLIEEVETLAAGGGGGGSNLVFEWNNVDTTQLATSQVLPAPAFATGMSNVNSALTLGPTNSDTLKTLQLAADEILYGASIWMFDDLVNLGEHIYRWSIGYPNPGPAALSGEGVSVGAVYAGDGTDGLFVVDWITFADDGAGNITQTRQVLMVNPVDAVTVVLYQEEIVGGYANTSTAQTKALRNDSAYAGLPGVPTGSVDMVTSCFVPPPTAPGSRLDGGKAIFSSTFLPPGAQWAVSGCNRIGVVLGGAWTNATSGAQTTAVTDFLVTKVKT